MATLERQRSGIYRTRVFFDGEQRTISLRTTSRKEAEGLLKGIENALWRYKTGNADLEVGVDPWEWIAAGGKRVIKPTKTHTFAELVEHYETSMPVGAKAASTRQGERIHIGHLQSILGKRLPLTKLTKQAVQEYVSKRSRQKWRGRPIRGATIRKELRTLSILWTYADSLGWVNGRKPTLGVVVSRPEPKEPFRTFAEISSLAGNATPERQEELWESCFLDQKELGEFLKHCKQRSPTEWFYPVVATCAYAGIRRSEWIRSRIEDWDFGRSSLTVREKKRTHHRQGSTRVVEIHPELAGVIRQYLRKHVGGSLMFAELPDVPISVHQAVDRWKVATAKSKWLELKGYHVLRHSFCSNLAAAGVLPTIIDKWVGHQTAEQRDRYRHLHPTERGSAIASLTFRG